MRQSIRFITALLLTTLVFLLPGYCAAHDHSSANQMSSQQVSVLERFSTYNGARTPEALAELFSGLSTGEVRQQPLISLSDGKTVVIIAASIHQVDDKAVSFSIEGGKQISVKKLKVGEWEFRVLPDKGTSVMALLLMQEGRVVRFPLAVAQALPAETDLSEQGFINYLRLSGEASGQVQADLNKDGKKDYLDDYIFTANYLVKQSLSGKNPEARRQRALQRTLAAPKSLPIPEPRKEYDGVFYGNPD